MQRYQVTKQRITLSLIMIIASGVFLLPRTGFAETAPLPSAPDNPATAFLNLTLPDTYTTPPPPGMQNDLRISNNTYYGSLDRIEPRKTRPFGYQQLKVDKSMRVRGWEIKDDIYIGQTRVGKKWGLGMMATHGGFAYGFNNKGVGMTYSGENSIYRLNMQEISLEIDF